FAEGLKYGIDLKLGSRNFYDSFRPFKSLTPDLMNMWYTQLGLAGGWGNERFQSLVYIDIPLILDDLGQWNENTGSGRRGNYGKLNVGGDLLFKIQKNEEIKDEDMDLSFHVAVDYQQEVLNKMIQHDLLKVKLGPYSNFNENNEDIFKAAALYLTLNNLKVKGLGQLKNYQEDTGLYPGVEANGVFRLGNVVFIPTIGWNNEQKLYGGLVVAYSARKQKQ
ncbi:hypothetical protein B6U93_03430, partial [Candidatus Woesearchaeota archaeon ex4484_78]